MTYRQRFEAEQIAAASGAFARRLLRDADTFTRDGRVMAAETFYGLAVFWTRWAASAGRTALGHDRHQIDGTIYARGHLGAHLERTEPARREIVARYMRKEGMTA
jgi:hypothetical protein